MTFAAPAWALRSACAVLALAAGLSQAAPIRRVLIDHTLVPREVTIAAISTDRIELAHPDGSTEPVPLADVAAILPIGGDASDPMAWLEEPGRTRVPVIATLVDGQRVLGHLPVAGVDLVSPEPVEDAAFVELPGANAVGVPLDRLAHLLLMRSETEPAPAAGDDTALLRNGDLVAGYVLAVQPRLEMETDAGIVRLALADVAHVALANPPERPRTTLVALEHGAVLGVSEMSTALNQTVRLTLALGSSGVPADSESSSDRATVQTPLESILSITPASGGARPLASLSLPLYAPTGDRRWSPAPETIGHPSHAFSSVVFPGPLRATWALPEGTSRFAARATLGDVPGVFADCEVVITADTSGGPVELHRTRLTASDASRELLVQVPEDSDAITLAVLPGENGPVHDRVTFERPIILVD